MWLKSKRVSFDFLPGRGRRDPHIDVQGTFHHNVKLLAFKECDRKIEVQPVCLRSSIPSPSSRGSLRLSAWLLSKSCSKWVQTPSRPQVRPVLPGKKVKVQVKKGRLIFLPSIAFHLTSSEGNKTKKNRYP